MLDHRGMPPPVEPKPRRQPDVAGMVGELGLGRRTMNFDYDR